VTPRYRPSRTALIASAVVLALAPFGVAVLRVVRTGNDVRYLWVALAAFAGAVGVALIGRARARTGQVVVQQAVVAFLVATLLSVRVARLLGARSWPAIFAVSIVFALFFTASTTLYALSRP
jgi:drug/metabolite transporter (DMT)-like permease